MFGRGKSEQTITRTPPAGVEGTRDSGKGRATPKRREVEQRNRHPIVATPVLAPNATKEQRTAAKQARRTQTSRERTQQRAAMLTGDERYLPPRDKGPARRFARDYVDARRNVGEYFIPVALVIMIFSLVKSPVVSEATLVALYSMVLFVVVDSYLLRRRVTRLVAARFDARAPGLTGIGTYGALRAIQLRRWRTPRPQVTRGQYPS